MYLSTTNSYQIEVSTDVASSGRQPTTPLSFSFENGESHRIADIRHSYTDKLEDALRVHFIVRTTDDRYFDILFDSDRQSWFVVIELEDQLRFAS